jgi:hypothetical protein
MTHSRFFVLFVLGGALLTARVLGAPAKRPAKPVPKPAVKPATPKPAPITQATLGPVLKALGYPAEPHESYWRVKIEEEGRDYVYQIDLSFTQSREWLVGMAHLAPIADLTMVPSGPLLALLTENDGMVGMSFSYDRTNGRIMLNASAPTRGLDAAGVKKLVDGIRGRVIQTQGLWDSSKW